MRYIECGLTDRGFVDGEDKALVSIEGRDNTTQPFRHLGYDGYPESRLMAIDVPGDVKTKTLVIMPDGAELPQGSTEIPAADVVDLLVAEYAWPEGARLVDGIPTWPERAL
ncbi:MAG: hypothetical protein KKF77_02930 [Proteobacteria bacterium]|nr:hypothetical protein [Pseudomonadota bacterium]